MSYLHPITPPLSHPLLIYPPPPICLPSLSHPLPIYLSSLSSPASHHLFITLQRSLGRVTVSIKENENIFRQGPASRSLLGESKPRPNRKAASWFPNNYMGVPPGTLTAPLLLSSGSVSSKRADWEWAWVHAKVFWEGLQRTYLLSGEESGNGLVSEGRYGWKSWVKARVSDTESQSEIGSWVIG